MTYTEWARGGFYAGPGMPNMDSSSRYNVSVSRLSGTRGGRPWVRVSYTLLEVRDGRVVVAESFHGGSASEAAAHRLARLRSVEEPVYQQGNRWYVRGDVNTPPLQFASRAGAEAAVRIAAGLS